MSVQPIIVDLKYECNAGKSGEIALSARHEAALPTMRTLRISEPSEDNADKGSHRWWGRLGVLVIISRRHSGGRDGRGALGHSVLS